MMAIAGVIPVAKWLAKIKQRSEVICRICKWHENNTVRALKICRKRRMGTSKVLSAMEWRQPSRLPTTSSGLSTRSWWASFCSQQLDCVQAHDNHLKNTLQFICCLILHNISKFLTQHIIVLHSLDNIWKFPDNVWLVFDNNDMLCNYYTTCT